MRFLCLHGRGTNADIFESQLSPLISQLSPDHSFDFIDAQFEGPAAPGITGVFPGPYFVWHKEHSPQSVEKVHDYLDTVIDEDGPYDGIIGFSEGAALAASYLLSKEYRATALGDISDCPENEIKLAIFFNSIKPYSPSEEIGSDATNEFQQELRRHSRFLKGQAERRRSSVTSQDMIDALTERRQSPVFCFNPDSFPCKIQVPTLNVIGAKDQFQDYSMELTKLCDPEQREVAVLDIGHDIPRNGEGLERITEAFEMIVMMASVGGG
ncbi:EF-hand calcium-binding domain protein [Delitschia confertaspora ATCC 74209]|uniref:EF-hand calcium-binding domain protein n=1 Tax=Delitschia confertaspora ATCC 74209 TaxID=1513339 RepID=A0A9P4MXF2_9PLEO|nr:EF-hand calcium-binding domain protein [Delitschia confertaspora ATCC 74209]